MIRSVRGHAVFDAPLTNLLQSLSFSSVPLRARSWRLSVLDGVLPLVLVLHRTHLIRFGMFSMVFRGNAR